MQTGMNLVGQKGLAVLPFSGSHPIHCFHQSRNSNSRVSGKPIELSFQDKKEAHKIVIPGEEGSL